MIEETVCEICREPMSPHEAREISEAEIKEVEGIGLEERLIRVCGLCYEAHQEALVNQLIGFPLGTPALAQAGIMVHSEYIRRANLTNETLYERFGRAALHAVNLLPPTARSARDVTFEPIDN